MYRSYFTKNIVKSLPTFIFSENVMFYIFLKKYRLNYRVPVPRYFFRPSTEYRYRGTFTKYRHYFAHLWSLVPVISIAGPYHKFKCI